MITFSEKGSFTKFERYLERLKTSNIAAILHKYGAQGVQALAAATPQDKSLTANSWRYAVVQRKGYSSIRWYNTHMEAGKPIAILLQYGHGTRTGGWVEGRDYIMPAIRPIFDRLAAEVWGEVTKI